MSRRLGDTLVAVSVFSLIFVVGLQYSFYQVFQQFHAADDEGTTMLQVRAFIEDLASYESLSSLFGPMKGSGSNRAWKAAIRAQAVNPAFDRC
jgi:hypothetical protein